MSAHLVIHTETKSFSLLVKELQQFFRRCLKPTLMLLDTKRVTRVSELIYARSSSSP